MSRFGNLEFDGPPRHEEQAGPQLKDHAFYLAEAGGYFEAGCFEKALRSFARALEHNPKHAAAWTGQVRMLIELGEFKEAALWAEKALAVFPKEAELLAAKAVALARCGDTKGAIAYSDASIEMDAQTPYVWLARGDVLLARGEKRAEHCFTKALALARDHWMTAWLASRIHYFHKQAAKALRFAQQALALDAVRAVVWQQMGRCEAALGMDSKARQSIEHARELDPQCPGLDTADQDSDRPSWLGRLLGRWLVRNG